MKHKGIRIALNVLPIMVGFQVFYFVLGLAIFGLAAYLWTTEYCDHSLFTRHVSHA